MQLSEHALERQRTRGISDADLDFTLQYGRRSRNSKKNAIEVEVIAREGKGQANSRMFQHLSGLTVLLSNDQTIVITLYWKPKSAKPSKQPMRSDRHGASNRYEDVA